MSMYSLNNAISQLQELLLDESLAEVGSEDQHRLLEESLNNCKRLFEKLDKRIQKTALTRSDQALPRRAWESVKLSFNENKMQELRQSLESEKNTLLLAVQDISL